MKATCGRILSRLPHHLPDHYTFWCECGCGRAWELRARTRWLTYTPWIRHVPARDGSRVWVRLSRSVSELAQAIGERGW